MDRVSHNTHTTLSIRISTDGFCFCSYTASSPDTLRYHHYQTDCNIPLAANFDAAWSKCPFAGQERYKEVKVILATDSYTVLPAEYDNTEEHGTLYRSCFPDTPKENRIIANSLTAQGATILFSIDEVLYNRLRQIGDISIYASASILLGFIARKQPDERSYMLAFFHKGKTHMLAMNGSTLQLANSFASEHTHDQAFYLLSIWKEQGFSQTEDTLYLCGDKRVEELHTFISRFIKSRKRINPSERFQPSLLNRIKEIPFDLQALILCE
jgi:hypothetical protein